MKQNKYQEAWRSCFELSDITINNFDLVPFDMGAIVLKELVDKEKPMKPLHISLLSNPPQNIIACGNCKGNNLGQSFKYCPSCRQKIDWNDEE